MYFDFDFFDAQLKTVLKVHRESRVVCTMSLNVTVPVNFKKAIKYYMVLNDLSMILTNYESSRNFSEEWAFLPVCTAIGYIESSRTLSVVKC